jgi:succinyl-CoA synthetase alpha subunit
MIIRTQAVETLQPDAASVFVPAMAAGKAIEEAIEAEVPLIVSVAEHIPVHDMLRVQEILQTQSKSRLVGPNCPGIIAPGGGCRIGIMPFRQYSPGKIGIVSKSGTLSYEAVGATTREGLGQSLVMGMGGDMLPGTTLADALTCFYDHEPTEGIVIIGEIGGTAEFDAAESIREYQERTNSPKPVVAMVAGRTAPKGKVMGHAGALLSPGDQGAEAKAKALSEAGARVVMHPGLIGSEMRKLLEERAIMEHAASSAATGDT